MLTRLIVALYTRLLEGALWVALAIAAVAGYQFTVPIMSALGATLTPELAWKVLGALVFAAVAFLVLAIVAGPFLVLVEMRHTVRTIAAHLERSTEVRESSPYERKEPSI